MARVVASITVPGSVAETEATWHDPSRWPSWVDGFARIHRLDGDWPREQARRIWDSRPGGRGRVVETVTRYAEHEGQSLAVEDERVTGTQRVHFEPAGPGTRVTLELRFEAKERRLPLPLLDVLVARRALGGSLRRTLVRFAAERRAEFP